MPCRPRRRRLPRSRRRRPQSHPVDAVPVHVDDPGGPPVEADRVTDRRHPSQRRHDPATHRLVRRPVGDAGADPGAHLVGPPQAGHRPAAVAQLAPRRLRPVVLVAHLTDDLLDEVLERDHARGAAVLVDDHRELHPALAQLEEQRVEAQRLGYEHGLRHQRRHRHVAPAVERHGDGLLDVDDAVDVVPVGPDDRKARVAGAPGEGDDVGGGRRALDRRGARARRHDVGRGLVGEPEGCRDEPRRAPVQGPGLGRRAHERGELGRAPGGGQLLLGLDARGRGACGSRRR